MLLSSGKVEVVSKLATDVRSATELLHQNLEFEYVAIRAGFFQGLMNWLIAIALQIFSISSKATITLKARRLGYGLACSMVAMVCVMLAFYNHHLNYYTKAEGGCVSMVVQLIISEMLGTLHRGGQADHL